MLRALLLPILLQAKAVAPGPSWTGELTLTMKGHGTVEKTLSTGVRMQVTWKVDRVARGTVVLDRMFKGGGIAGTPNTRDTVRYETWIANSRQPLVMEVNDTATYFGPVGTPKQIALDVARYRCPAADARDPAGQLRSSILQFDYEKGTYSFEARLGCSIAAKRVTSERPNVVRPSGWPRPLSNWSPDRWSWSSRWCTRWRPWPIGGSCPVRSPKGRPRSC